MTGPVAFTSSYFGYASSSLVGLLFQLPSTGAAYNLTVLPFSKAFLTDPFSGSTISLGTFQNWTYVGQNLTFSNSGATNVNSLSGLQSLQYSGHAFTSGDFCPGSTTRRRGIFVSYVCGGYSIETGQTRGVVETASTDSTGCGMMVSVAIPEACGVNFTVGEELAAPSASPSPVSGPRSIVMELRDDPLIIGTVVKAPNGAVLTSQAVVLKQLDAITLLVPISPSNSQLNIVHQGQFAGWVTMPDPAYIGIGTAPLVYVGQRFANGDPCAAPFVNVNRSAFVKLTYGLTKNVTETIYNDATGCSVNLTYTNPSICGVNAAVGAEYASSSPTPSVTPSRTGTSSQTPSNTGTPSTTNTAPRSVTPSPSKSVSALPPGASPSPSSSPHVVGSEVTFNMSIPGCATRAQVRSSGLEGALLDSVSSAAGLDPSTVVLTDAQCQQGGSVVVPSTILSFSVAVDPPATSGVQAGSAVGNSVGGVNLGGAASGRDVVLANSILISQRLKSGVASSQGSTLVKNALNGVSSKWSNITGANLTNANITISSVVVDVSTAGLAAPPLCGDGGKSSTSSDSGEYTVREVVGATFASFSSCLLALLGFLRYCKFPFPKLNVLAADSDEVVNLYDDVKNSPHPQTSQPHQSSFSLPTRHQSPPPRPDPPDSSPPSSRPQDSNRKEKFEPKPFFSSSSMSESAGAFTGAARERGFFDPPQFTGANPMWSSGDPNDRPSGTGPKKGGRNKKSTGMTQEEYVNHF